jgi:hypothetical protein
MADLWEMFGPVFAIDAETFQQTPDAPSPMGDLCETGLSAPLAGSPFFFSKRA